jgi:hypothetical protein
MLLLLPELVQRLRHLLSTRSERGQASVEYLLMLVVACGVAFAVATAVSDAVAAVDISGLVADAVAAIQGLLPAA